ncbi:hypothetical protein BCV72DRAFT_200536 [Rhizopus microsporus var. microsporus]|uniref:Succinylglutamate desuccinylase/Aspartoacylase catalytic domain-containing protein n=1 Tax=Rhizopus microsporus var. microsporus TaxID=86635 RepID=A0A1X0RD93_RHIZD|nr:hypothetical protein BCV72DRAFT_200536 [Rhizopus microsporus var. microsporus]
MVESPLLSPRNGPIFQSESPDPSIIQAKCLKPSRDYISQTWKNGLGTTDEIAIYPPDKNFKQDDFFWRLSVNKIQSDCNFSLFPGYECTMIIMPTENEKASFSISHGETFMLKRDSGKAQIRIEKIGSYETDLQGDVDSGKNMLFGAFVLVYVVDGYVNALLDKNHAHGQSFDMKAGESLMIERDEDASPTSILLNATNEHFQAAQSGIEATVVIIQIEEGKTFGGVLQRQPDLSSINQEGIVPSQRRPINRRPSLLVSLNEQPPNNEEEKPEKDEKSRRLSILSLNDEAVPDRPLPTRRDSLAGISFDPSIVYEPPPFALSHQDTEVPPPVIRDKLEVDEFPFSTISTAWIKIMTQGLSEWVKLPVIVCRGKEDGVISQIDVNQLKGTLVAVPCVNVWGYLKFQREFADGRDLNRQFPGKEDGYSSQVFCHHLMSKIISQFNYMVDLHTASFGRVNSYYVRADMNDPIGSSMASLQQPQIILHNSGQDGTLRSAAAARGIKAITVEIGNPQTFQDRYVQWSFMGIMRILDHFKMFPFKNVLDSFKDESSEDDFGPSHTILCSRGFWIYTKNGGILEVYPGVNRLIRKGEIIARIKNMFGNIIEEYFAPCTGIVIGRSSNPVAMAGDRIVHLGVIKKTGEALAKAAKENY